MTYLKLIKTLDLVLIFISWELAYFFRFKIGLPGATFGYDSFFIYLGIFLVLLNYFFLRRSGLYSSKLAAPLYKEVTTVLRANFKSLFTFVVFIYFLGNDRVSRLTIIFYFFISTIFLTLVRALLKKKVLQNLNKKTLVIVGDGPITDELYRKLNQDNSEFKVVERVHEFNLDTISVLKPDCVAIDSKFKEHIEELYLTGVEVIYLPDLSFSLIGYNIKNMMGIPTITLNESRLDSSGAIFKRLMDIVLTSIGLVVLSPLFLMIALIIKLTSKGPILYGQVRMGLDNKEFKMWKFRSMVEGSANHGGWTVKDDPRVTSFGKFLRRTSLDEFPQLINVLVGEMSLVGPRPERPKYVEEFKKDIPSYMLRHNMKAGITGFAQINGYRGDTSIPKRIECDLYYIKNWSIWLDISIIFLTFFKGFFNKNAY